VLTDRATLDRFRAGDRATLAAVYRAHAPEVALLVARGFSFRAGADVHRFFGYRNPHQQQDAVQEVFVRAFSERGRASYDGITPYGAYLRGILKNLVVDEFRKRKSALLAFGSEDDADRAEAPGEPADVAVARKKLSDAMVGFVDALPEREKRFVALRYTDGLAQEDVAKRMKVGRSTVRTLEDRVRRRLYDRLQERGLVDAPAPTSRGFFARLLPAVVALLATGAAIGASHA
jgi:RNA polymerase sigma factor (sigma-70 family)